MRKTVSTNLEMLRIGFAKLQIVSKESLRFYVKRFGQLSILKEERQCSFNIMFFSRAFQNCRFENKTIDLHRLKYNT